MGYCDKLKKGKNMTEKKYKDWFTPEAREHYWEKLYKDMERRNMKLERQLYLARDERDEWRNYALHLEARQSPTKKWKLNKFTMDEPVYIEDKDQ